MKKFAGFLGLLLGLSLAVSGAHAEEEVSLADLLSPDELAQELGLEASPLDEEAPSDLESFLLGLEPTQYKDLEEVVVVINKGASGPTAQRVFVYEKGKLKSTVQVKLADGSIVTREGWPTSTGREKQETGKSGRKYVSTTPVGFFRPTVLNPKHWSTLWKTYLHHAIFFRGGVALHATTPDHFKELGKRASGGCARLHPTHAKTLFELVKAAGVGSVSEFERWKGAPTGKTIKAYRTLVIVRDVTT